MVVIEHSWRFSRDAGKVLAIALAALAFLAATSVYQDRSIRRQRIVINELKAICALGRA